MMNPEQMELTFSGTSAMRLDKFLAENLPGLSRAKLQTIISSGAVEVNGKVITKQAFKLDPGDAVKALIPEEAKQELESQDINLDVLYHDKNVIVLNKAAGLVVHPGAGNFENTLVNALVYHWPEIAEVGEPSRPGIVHRLDKDTSGVMIAARTNEAYKWLVKEFKSRRPKKTYLALVDGRPPTPTGRIETRIGRDEKNRQRMAVVYGDKGRKAVTEYFTVNEYPEHTLLEVSLLSGRTHQIRVHLAFLGCPVAGDRIYGRRKKTIETDRFFLHAHRLAIILPEDKTEREFVAPLPANLGNLLEQLRSN
ncbi:MAG: RluA family pseudouridine synthase [Anaerolineaceae bacterium]|nr:RluA family pseudouridine synthase [Anaerolineaceae bacterium]